MEFAQANEIGCSYQILMLFRLKRIPYVFGEWQTSIAHGRIMANVEWVLDPTVIERKIEVKYHPNNSQEYS